MDDILISIFNAIMVDIASDQVQDILHRILSGEELSALVAGGNDAATALLDGFSQHGIDLDILSDRDWSQIAQLFASGVVRA